MYIIATFYHFFDFPEFESKRQPILSMFKSAGITGTLLLANEGINGTIAGSRGGINAALDYLKTHITKSDFEHKESKSEKPPFPRTKVRLKKETISIGEPCPPELVGEYISPKDWNDFIKQPDTILLDTRNTYETHLGTFEGAIDPQIANFKELPKYVREQLKDAKGKKIATFCTGGIRCEKFTAWMKAEGFENVYHLKGGILKYLEEIPQEESSWKGECYVFDKRVAVGHGLTPSTTASMCYGCGHALLPEDRQHPAFEEPYSCGYCSEPAR